MPSESPSKLCGSDDLTLKFLSGISPQSRSGGDEGMQTSEYAESQLFDIFSCSSSLSMLVSSETLLAAKSASSVAQPYFCAQSLIPNSDTPQKLL